jgi:hypothetical protein
MGLPSVDVSKMSDSLSVTLHWREYPEWQRGDAADQVGLPQPFVTEANLGRDDFRYQDGPLLVLEYEDWQALGGPVTLEVTVEPGQRPAPGTETRPVMSAVDLLRSPETPDHLPLTGGLARDIAVYEIPAAPGEPGQGRHVAVDNDRDAQWCSCGQAGCRKYLDPAPGEPGEGAPLDRLLSDLAVILRATYDDGISDEAQATIIGRIVVARQHLDAARAEAAGLRRQTEAAEGLAVTWHYLEDEARHEGTEGVITYVKAALALQTALTASPEVAP